MPRISQPSARVVRLWRSIFALTAAPPEMTAVKYEFKPASVITLNTAPYGQYLTLDSSSNASGGSFSIPLKARYVRTSTVSAGTANSAAEFVMTYE